VLEYAPTDQGKEGTVIATQARTTALRAGFLPRWATQFAYFLIVTALLILLWEGYKALGAAVDYKIPGTEQALPLRPNDYNLPHVWDIVGALFLPARRGGETLILILLRSALFTWLEAAVGFLIGAALGFGLGVLFAHSSLLERGLLPYVVASQTVPMLAIAPMVVIWLRGFASAWLAVAVIAAYLTFFPVTINTLRGLRSPDTTAVELMHSYAATDWEILWKLRIPAALPYIFTALKISATASVVGAIVGELPSGIQAGLGRAILNFNQYYLTGPEKLWAAIIIASLVGIVFFLIIVAIEKIVIHQRPALEITD
jgi:NitT/TauT family transport system permease protein